MNGKIVGMTEKPTGKARMPEQDIAKGIAILLVLALHTLTLKRSVYLVCGGIFGFIMPFFFGQKVGAVGGIAVGNRADNRDDIAEPDDGYASEQRNQHGNQHEE